jgi:hypothetical protein
LYLVSLWQKKPRYVEMADLGDGEADVTSCLLFRCIGTYSATSRSEEIELEYPAALCNALAKVQQQGRAFTWVQLSGALVVTDQQRSLWFYPVTRKIKVMEIPSLTRHRTTAGEKQKAIS